MKSLPKRKEIKTESVIENIVLREFHLLGLYPTPQFEIGRYRIDLAFPDMLIAIECDGQEWHSSKEQIDRDKKRDDYLEKMGWRVIRMSGSDIYRRADEIVGFIVGMKELRKNKFQNPVQDKIKIDYENDSLDMIEEKEESLRIQQEEKEELPEGLLRPISEMIKERYRHSFN